MNPHRNEAKQVIQSMDVRKLISLYDTLPPGHYGLREIEGKLDKEYKNAREVARKYFKSFPYFITPNDAVKLAGKLSITLRVKPLKRIVLNSEEAYNCSGLYFNKEIHLPSEHFSYTTFLHEFAHHVCAVERHGVGHNSQYCEMLDLVFLAALDILKT